ncbi:hypothetical protein BN14_03907 [Rhizoctonia solani AG-1 IB]|uniref:Uncharacterized protein n=1 Tax=Thanatephorus cucumeris (strain AG1-IB / isolate 7/3/14) TaxID=1108050 RepID=M5BRR1_THACB|nr:hypothetical protein BN14_03907 [Rhizoctonia solani AG-1 IB]
MVVLAPRFASFLACSLAAVNALPYNPETEALGKVPFPALVPRPGELEARGHHHHHHHHHHKHKHNRRDLENFDSVEHMEDEDAPELHVPRKRHSHHSGSPLRLERRKHHHGTDVHADDPVVITGDHNHVHTHTHGGHGRKHGHHRHGHHRHGHGTKIYADDPLIVSGDGNHVHSHSHRKRSGVCEDSNLLEMSRAPMSGFAFDSPADWHGLSHSTLGTMRLKRGSNLETRRKHRGYDHHRKPLELTAVTKRGLLDNLVPLLAPVPGIAGVIDIVGGLSRAVLSEPLASLIITPKPTAGAMGIQSADGEQLPGYPINASNSTSTTMYLVPQDGAQANLGPKEKPVLVTMPMLQTKDNSVKLYCASYDPNSKSPSQLTSQPCVYSPNAGLDINSSSTHMSQLFAWNIEDGSISPLWHEQTGSGQAEAANAPSGTSDPTHSGGYVIGGTPSVNAADAEQPAPNQFSMLFRAHPVLSSNRQTSTEPTILASSTTSTTGNSEDSSHTDQSGDDNLDEQNSNPGSDDDEQGSSEANGANQLSQEGTGQDELAPVTTAEQDAAPLATSTLAPAAMRAEIVTSTFTMLVSPTESLDAPDAGTMDSISGAAPSPTTI